MRRITLWTSLLLLSSAGFTQSRPAPQYLEINSGVTAHCGQSHSGNVSSCVHGFIFTTATSWRHITGANVNFAYTTGAPPMGRKHVYKVFAFTPVTTYGINYEYLYASTVCDKIEDQPCDGPLCPHEPVDPTPIVPDPIVAP